MGGRANAFLGGLTPTLRGMLWMAASGALFSTMNTAMKAMSHDLDPWVVGYLRYFFGFVVLLPLLWRLGVRGCMTNALGLNIARGAFHSFGIVVWAAALPLVSMADMTAIGFTGPIWICLGAVLFLGERMTWARTVAVGLGFVGVLVVVQPWQGAGFSGVTLGNLLLLICAPAFAGSFLVAKVLVKHDRPELIVFWQHLTCSVFTLPFAIFWWTSPSLGQWVVLALCGVGGSMGHYCMTRAFRIADISAVQPVKFLDLVWASLGGFVVFAAIPGMWTVVGAAVIFFSTLWLARHEAVSAARTRRAAAAAAAPPSTAPRPAE